MAGNDDGIVNVGAHLDGTDNQVAKEVQRGVLNGGEGEIQPDGALNHNDEQHRQTRRLEGEQQNEDDEQRRQHADEVVVVHEGAGQVQRTGGVAHHIALLFGIVALQHLMDGAEEGEGLFTFLRQIQIHHQTAVFLALQLQFGLFQLVEQVVQRVLHIALQRDVAVLHLLF